VKSLQITPKVKVGRGLGSTLCWSGNDFIAQLCVRCQHAMEKLTGTKTADPRRFIDLTILDELEKEGFLKTLYRH
jgi:hypothetical protein